MIFSAEKHSEIKSGLSANLHGGPSSRYVAGMMSLLLSASLYTVILRPLEGLGESDHDVLGKTAFCKPLIGKLVLLTQNMLVDPPSPLSPPPLFLVRFWTLNT